MLWVQRVGHVTKVSHRFANPAASMAKRPRCYRLKLAFCPEALDQNCTAAHPRTLVDQYVSVNKATGQQGVIAEANLADRELASDKMKAWFKRCGLFGIPIPDDFFLFCFGFGCRPDFATADESWNTDQPINRKFHLASVRLGAKPVPAEFRQQKNGMNTVHVYSYCR